MGGFGSGERSEKKRTVEMCLILKASRFGKRLGRFERFLQTEMHWTNSFGKLILSVRYRLENTGERPVLHLLSRTDAKGRKQPMWESIVLTSTRPHFGGLRWWFVCPLVDKDVACERRVGKLYLPRGAYYFGCRACFDLTYESAQTNDDRVNRLMKNPVALVNAINSNDAMESLRGLRAYGKVMGWLK